LTIVGLRDNLDSKEVKANEAGGISARGRAPGSKFAWDHKKGVCSMAIAKRLQEFLKEKKIEYRVFTHPEVYTAQEVAASMHVPGRELAKVVMVKADERLVMTVIPASTRVDFTKLKEILKTELVTLSTEAEFEGLFPDADPGAEPPFGNLYDVETIVDKALTEDEGICFNAGSHYEAVEISYKDYEGAVMPTVADFAVPLH